MPIGSRLLDKNSIAYRILVKISMLGQCVTDKSDSGPRKMAAPSLMGKIGNVPIAKNVPNTSL